MIFDKTSEQDTIRFDYTLLLSCQRSVESLNKTLVDVLIDVIAGYDFRLYLSSNVEHNNTFYILYSTEDEIERPEELHFINQFNTEQHNAVDESIFTEKKKVFYPAILNGQFFACVVTDRHTTDIIDAHLISILAIYTNVLNLITDSKIDGLTGLLNRKSFDQELTKERLDLDEVQRRRSDIKHKVGERYLTIIDIDHFKAVNDKYGHLVGDDVLVLLAKMIQQNFRDHDGLYRYGGEEFAIILRDILHQDTVQVLQRFCQLVREQFFPIVENITISIGFSVINPNESADSIIERADKALYYSKNNGRDQVTDYALLETAVELTENAN